MRVIWILVDPYATIVIPAQAGIQRESCFFLDSRLRALCAIGRNHLRQAEFAPYWGSHLLDKELPRMERELWNFIAAHLTHLSRNSRTGRFQHPTTRIVRVYLWAVLHDRPVYWACDSRNWIGVKPPRQLPDQSTMSRRLTRPQTRELLEALLDRLEPVDHDALVMRMDGKPLPVAKHSQDRQATVGRGAGGMQKGYKLHAIYARKNRPIAYHVAPMNVDERVVAQQMIRETGLGEGYLLADANYETNPLYEQAASIGRVLVTPRRFKDAKGLGQSRVHSPHRIAMIQRMKDPSPFIRELLHSRRAVETRLANLSNFGGGLTHLPPWVRGRRVTPYVTAKILIRLARDHMLRGRAAA